MWRRPLYVGIADGCRQAGCALIGGETAEMPGMYGDGEYDLAALPSAPLKGMPSIDGQTISDGDIILGLSSNGVHSNGFSLVRRVVERVGVSFSNPAPFDSRQTLGEALLAPTKIYVKTCLAAIAAGGVRGIAHITGGGLVENIPRVLPDGIAARSVEIAGRLYLYSIGLQKKALSRSTRWNGRSTWG